MAACESLIPVLKFLLQEDIHGTVGKLLRLSVEKMDRVRIVAGRTLCTIILQWTDAAGALKEIVAWYFIYLYFYVDHRADRDIFAIPSKLYPAATSLLALDRYHEELLTGFVISSGGLGESLVSFVFT
jgi:Tubulin folding cofactor D C terminal